MLWSSFWVLCTGDQRATPVAVKSQWHWQPERWYTLSKQLSLFFSRISE